MNFDTLRFGAGRPGDHDEQAALVQGRGAYTSDVELPGQLHACFVRSVHAHAHIRAIDTTKALALPGVHAVITGAQILNGLLLPTILVLMLLLINRRSVMGDYVNKFGTNLVALITIAAVAILSIMSVIYMFV